MGWKSLAWIGCLLPALVGCGVTHHAGHKLPGEMRVSRVQRGPESDPRTDAHAAWLSVQTHHPQRAFTAEFQDGFLDGFVDRLERGRASQPPAVPLLKAVRPKKYLVGDYHLGFQYGADVAVATRQLPREQVKAEGSPPSSASPIATAVPFVAARPSPMGSSRSPTRTAATKPGGATRPTPNVIREPPVLSGADLLPVPDPPLPVAVLPVPPDEVPKLPTILDDLPVIPFRFQPLPPLPFTNLTPAPAKR